MRNSFKQLFRKPAKPLLFFFLMAAATMLLVFGGAMYYQSVLRTRALEALFTTVGTVEQPLGTDPDAGNDLIYPEALDFEGADYIIPPKPRPMYLADLSGYNQPGSYGKDFTFDLLEFKVTGKPAKGPLTAVITQVFQNGTARMDQLQTGWEYNEDIRTKPGMEIELKEGWSTGDLEVGKTYIGYVNDGYTHQWRYSGDFWDSPPGPFWPMYFPYTSLLDDRGNPVEGSLTHKGSGYQEVTPGFYDEGGGFQAWENLLDSAILEDNVVPVVPVTDWNLIACCRNNTLRVRPGSRMITQEELDSGAKVCMVSKEYAQKNLLYEGDTIKLPLLASLYNYYSDYDRWSFYMPGGTSLLDPEGNIYEPFAEEEYEIVGIYTLQYQNSELPYKYMFIIPAKSVGDVEDEHILYYGPMRRDTTAFQIQNGTVEAFTAAFEAAVPGADRLNLSFDDMGYSRAMESINDSKGTAFLLFAVGLLAAAAIVALLMYFFVVLEKKRTAIERSLGMTRRQCLVSLMAGILALTLAATLAGSAGAAVLLDKVDAASQARIEEQNKAAGEDGAPVVDWGLGGVYNFSAKYSTWAMWDVKGNQAALETITPPPAIYLLAPGLLCILVGLLSASLINHNLKIEPILLLNSK